MNYINEYRFMIDPATEELLTLNNKLAAGVNSLLPEGYAVTYISRVDGELIISAHNKEGK